MQLIITYQVVFTLSLYEDVSSSGKADIETDKGCEQKTMIGEEKATLPHDGQSHSTEATKFSLTSLLTSSGCGTSHTTMPISSSSETTTASLTDTNQSLQRNSRDFNPPLTTNTLLTHRKALSSNFNGHNIEESLHLKCENNHEKLMKSSIDTKLSADAKSESRTNLLPTSDSSSSDIGDGNDSSTTLDLSAVKPNAEVSKAEPTSECAGAHGAHAPDTDNSSASTSKTRTVGLMDLLTTAVEDKNSSVVLDTHEDKWMFPHAVKEVRVSSNLAELQHCACAIQVPFTRRSRKRPHPDDDIDDLTLSEYSAKRHEVMDEEGYHSGTTAVVCILKGDELTVANAGDSRCVVSSKGQHLYQVPNKTFIAYLCSLLATLWKLSQVSAQIIELLTYGIGNV